LNFSGQNTAILLFARNPYAEARNKNFLKGKSFKRNLKLGQRLFKATHRKCVNAGLPLFHLDENLQYGDSFSERLKNAFQSVYDLGYDNVIAVGGDCPSLSVSNLVLAAEKMKVGNAVLGQTQKGGVYLIGVSKKDFSKIDFKEILWNSKNVFTQVLTAISIHSEIFLLQKKSEYNTCSDLKDLSAHLNDKLSNWIIGHSSERDFDSETQISLWFYECLNSCSKRGPPLPS